MQIFHPIFGKIKKKQYFCTAFSVGMTRFAQSAKRAVRSSEADMRSKKRTSAENLGIQAQKKRNMSSFFVSG